MSDIWGGPGWWMATDGKWYPPIVHEAETNGGRGGADELDEVLVRPSNDTIDLNTSTRTIELDAFDVHRDATDGVRQPIDLRTQVGEGDRVLASGRSDLKNGAVSDQIPEAGQPAPVSVSRLRTRSASVDQATSESSVEEPAPPADGPLIGWNEPTESEPPAETSARGSRSGLVLLAFATLLAIAAGVLGALWIRERSTSEDLRTDLASAQVEDPGPAAQIEELENQVRTLEAQNNELSRELGELRPLLADVPTGRISEIAVPFPPAFVDEVRGRLFAIDADGSFLIWGDGVDAEITDSGQVEGAPTGLVAIGDAALVATSTGAVESISMIGEEDGQPVQSGVIRNLDQDRAGYWAFAPESNELRRYRVANGRITTSIALPTPVRDLTVGAGAVWALGEDGLVYRVNTADFTLSPFTAGQEVIAVAAGPDALWALSAADGSLRRLDAVSGDVLVTVPVGRDPIDAVFSGNSVWVVLRSGETLIEVDTRTSAVVSRTKLPGTPVSLSPGETGVLVTLEGDVPVVRVASVEVDEAVEDGDAAGETGEAAG